MKGVRSYSVVVIAVLAATMACGSSDQVPSSPSATGSLPIVVALGDSLTLGANDGLRGAPPAVVESNPGQIIEKAQARGIDVLLCTMEAPPIGGFEYTLAFHRIFARLQERYHIVRGPFVMIDVFADPNLTQGDRIHPNAAGARMIADRLWPYLEPMLKK